MGVQVRGLDAPFAVGLDEARQPLLGAPSGGALAL
jgi:hypothetical protein